MIHVLMMVKRHAVVVVVVAAVVVVARLAEVAAPILERDDRIR